MYERMRSAKEIIEEMKAGFSDMFEGSDGRECLGCRITFKIYKGFTDMPHAMTTNKKTGEWISINAIRALPTGYDMMRALGQDDECRCRNRSAGPFDEQFTLRDVNGLPLADTDYTIEWRGFLTRDVTDSMGRTQRHKTNGAQALRIYLGHRESV
ncbi:hypothetical protein AB3X96_20245 [Paraburkholderia sp. BR13439]|uniref:hypothetical protein n=1 Tax=Paraburkholderia sp. BR13439 TaxID=3236996 RepID=UPI0034CE1A6C